MIKSVYITNYMGDSLLLPLSDYSESGIIITNIDGLGPVEADIHTTDYATRDGSVFNSSRALNRNIVFTLRPVEHPSIEAMRHRIYKFFPVKRQVKIEVITDQRDAYAIGYVESVDPDIFSNEEEVEVSIICPDPYFYSTSRNEVVYSGAEPIFEFPFSNEGNEPQIIMGIVQNTNERVIDYRGDFDVGLDIHLQFSGSATGVAVHNIEENKVLRIDTSKIPNGLQNQDELIISTRKGSKSAQILRNGHYINAINAVAMTSDWITLHMGANTIIYTADSGLNNITMTLEFNVAYEGI